MTAVEVTRISTSGEYASRRPWTSKEIRRLEQLAELGAAAIAAELDRPVRSVQTKAARLGISLRQPGSRVGRLLGQPLGASWADARALAETLALHARIREDLAAGRITIVDLERAHAATVAGVELCPQCVRNHADHADGLCTACHRRQLADVHRQALDEHAAEAELWAARQEKSRAKRRKKANHE